MAIDGFFRVTGTRVVMRTGSSTVRFLLADHPSLPLGTGLGSTAITTDSTGMIGSEIRDYPWGGDRYSAYTTSNTYRYTGQRAESYINLYWYGSRWYDSYLNRWIQPDSIITSNTSSYTALIVDYHETQFLYQLNQKNRSQNERSQSIKDSTPANSQAFDRYAYAFNNPVRYNDPTGHRNCEEDGYNCYVIRPLTVTEKALKGDVSSAIDLITPTHGGIRGQIEFSGGSGIGVSGTIGLNIIYNRNDNRFEGNIDYSIEPGPGVGIGVSAAGGIDIGWGSSSVKDTTSGYSGILSATAAAEGAASVAIVAPMEGTNLQNISGLHIDPYYGQVPVTIYIGGGAGGAYASAGGGINGTLLHFDLPNLLR